VLTAHDELLAHQLATTFDHVEQADLRWTERIVMFGFEKSGEYTIVTGLARYPNRNVTDAYAMIIARGGETRVVRMSTQIDTAPVGLGSYTVGPYTYAIEEPLQRTRATLVANSEGVELDLVLDGEYPAYEQTPAFHRERGRIKENARRFYQNGRVTGHFTIDGKRVDLDPDQWWFTRDHSWGLRYGPGGGSLAEGGQMQPGDIPAGALYYMGIFRFDDELVHFAQREDHLGNRIQFEGEVLTPTAAGGGTAEIIDVEHDLKWRPGRRLIDAGSRFTVLRGDRTTSELELSPRSDYWPAFAGYEEFNGYASGYWRGTDFLDGYTVNGDDPEVVAPISLLSGTLCQARMPLDDGTEKIGYGLVEMVFVGANPRYGFEGW